MPKRITPKTEQFPTAAAFLPPVLNYASLKSASKGCRGCDLYLGGTQTVFGAGAARSIMLVGEQPGDREDIEGEPFVGPAGKLLGKALEEVGIDRKAVYVTNAVKHFKWAPRGKRRIHKKPSAAQIAACKPWLEAEIQVMKPQVVVCLGATAAQTLLGRTFKVTVSRGKPIPSQLAPHVLATVHPSALLRAPDEESRREGIRQFTQDLRVAADLVREERRAA